MIEVSWANCDLKDKAYTWLSGTHGIVAMNPMRLTRRQKDQIEQILVPSSGAEVKVYRNSYKLEMSHFLSCVRSRREPISTGREAVAVLEVLEKVYKSAGR
jgi:predicted dehydrogenase